MKWGGLALLLLVLALAAPIGYVETFCRAAPDQEPYVSIVTDPEFVRGEANSYLTYPEWHIVYAYEGLANKLKSGDEHEFGYTRSVAGFWRSYCALNRKANQHGGGEFGTRLVIYTIGASFTLEMGAKALYEETVGRLFATLRGEQKTPQDAYAAEMADDYATFLQQTPWFKYDFAKAGDLLWQQPVSGIRSWERRVGLGLEFWAKKHYARFIAENAGLAGAPQLRFRSVVTGLTLGQLRAIPEVDVVAFDAGRATIETPRYRKLTRILEAITRTGGTVQEIAGNDDIMLSAIEPKTDILAEITKGELLSRIPRDGFDTNRILIALKVHNIGPVLEELEKSGRTLEHIYDY